MSTSTILKTDLFVAATTGTSKWVDVTGGSQDLVFTFTSVGTTSGGTLLIEESDDSGSAATASVIATVTAASFTGGAKTMYHVRMGAPLFVRVRISSDITGGGSVSVTLAGS